KPAEPKRRPNQRPAQALAPNQPAPAEPDQATNASPRHHLLRQRSRRPPSKTQPSNRIPGTIVCPTPTKAPGLQRKVTISAGAQMSSLPRPGQGARMPLTHAMRSEPNQPPSYR